jgi:hypothetical protein
MAKWDNRYTGHCLYCGAKLDRKQLFCSYRCGDKYRWYNVIKPEYIKNKEYVPSKKEMIDSIAEALNIQPFESIHDTYKVIMKCIKSDEND